MVAGRDGTMNVRIHWYYNGEYGVHEGPYMPCMTFRVHNGGRVVENTVPVQKYSYDPGNSFLFCCLPGDFDRLMEAKK